MNAWIVILAAGFGSYLFRLSMIVLVDRITLPAYLERASGLVARRRSPHWLPRVSRQPA
jgi:branched-subunit amino acid transport protein